MAEANGIRDLPKQDVQSILEGFSIEENRKLSEGPERIRSKDYYRHGYQRSTK